MNLLISLIGFFFSFKDCARHLPESHQRAAMVMAYATVGLFTVLCGVLGVWIGGLIGPKQGGPFVGAVSFAAAGFFTALSFVVYRMLKVSSKSGKDDAPSGMSGFTAIAIPVLSWIGLLFGVILGWFHLQDSEAAVLPFVCVLFGALTGAIVGLIYEKGVKAFLAVAGFGLGSYLMFLVVSWMEK